METNLSDELKALKETAARFAAVEIAPHAQEWDRLERYPDAMIRRLGDQGFMGVLVPEEYGGAGGSYTALAIVLEEIARHDGGLALAVEAHSGLCCEHILLAGTDEQKARFLPTLATGQQIGSWCLTEPSSGTDAASLKTRAVLEGKDWILNGSKQFITNGDRAGIYIVMAQAGGAGISAFIVERGTPGLTTGKPEEKLGMRSSDTVAVNFQNVRVPAGHLLGPAGRAFEDTKKVLERGRIMISAVSLGLARGAMEESVRYAHERFAFGRPIVEFQQVQVKIAEIAMNIEAARLLVSRATRLLDEGGAILLESAITKLFTSEMATRACLEAIQIHGGYGYLRSANVERYMRDAKLCEIGEGTSEILRLLIAREVSKKLGHSPPATIERASRSSKRAAS